MKKAFTVALTLALTLSLAACTSPKEDAPEDTSTPPTVSTEPNTPTPEPTDTSIPGADPIPVPETKPEQSKPEQSKPEQSGNQNQGQNKPEPPAPPALDENGNDTNGYGGGVVSIDDVLNWDGGMDGFDEDYADNVQQGFDPIQ